MFRCESATLKTYWLLVVMDQFTRRIIGFSIQPGDVDGQALCRMFNRAISAAGQPRCLSSDNDPLFNYHQWQANLRILEIEEIKTIPYVPMSHPFVERLIGTIRREFLDHVLFWTSHDLEQNLSEFKDYYNRHRVHSSLPRDAPAGLAGEVQNPKADLADYNGKHIVVDYSILLPPREYSFAIDRRSVWKLTQTTTRNWACPSI